MKTKYEFKIMTYYEFVSYVRDYDDVNFTASIYHSVEGTTTLYSARNKSIIGDVLGRQISEDLENGN